MLCSCPNCKDYEPRFEKEGRKLLLHFGDTLYDVTKAMRIGAVDRINQVPWNCAPYGRDTNVLHDWEAGHEMADCPNIAWQLAGLEHAARYERGDQVLVLVSWNPNKVWVEGRVRTASIKDGKWVYQVSAEIKEVRSTRTISAWRIQPRDPITKMGDLARG